MSVIFYMSSQVSDVSSSQSDNFIQIMEQIFHVSIFTQNLEVIEFIQTIVRKSAHAFSYFLLAYLCIQMFRYQKKMKHIGIYSIALSFLYACSDEFHQLFVVGRAGQWQDIFIDTCGAILAVCLFYVIRHLRKNVFITASKDDHKNNE